MAGVVEVLVAHSVVRVEEHGQPLLDEAQQTLEVAACIDIWIDRYMRKPRRWNAACL